MNCMNQWKYEVVVKECYHKDIGTYCAFGIAAHDAKSAKRYDAVHDVTLKRQTAEAMAKLFEEHQLSPIHLREAIENMLE